MTVLDYLAIIQDHACRILDECAELETRICAEWAETPKMSDDADIFFEPEPNICSDFVGRGL